MADDAMVIEDSQEPNAAEDDAVESQWRVCQDKPDATPPSATRDLTSPSSNPETTPENADKQRFKLLFEMCLKKKDSLEQLDFIS